MSTKSSDDVTCVELVLQSRVNNEYSKFGTANRSGRGLRSYMLIK